MPIHLEDLDVIPKVEGSDSALIVACNMCAGASYAMKENKPFIQFFSNFLTSPPLERRITKLQSQLREKGVETSWFKGGIIQKFFLCLWTSLQRSKFRKCVEKYDAVLVLGCDSAIKTIQDIVKGTDCRVIRGMKVEGVMNTKTKFNWPGNISFESSKVATMCDGHCEWFKKKSQQEKEETYQTNNGGYRQKEMMPGIS